MSYSETNACAVFHEESELLKELASDGRRDV